MDISAQLRDYLVGEWRTVAAGLAAVEPTHENLPNAVYLLSAVYGSTGRVMNIEYRPELVLIHTVAFASFNAINQRVNELLAGQNPAIGLASQLFARLAEIINDLADRVEKDEDFVSPLTQMAEAGNSTTGNGFYLYQTRRVGLKP